MLPHPELISKYRYIIKNEPRFNGVFQEIIYLKKIKDGAYITNLDKYANVSTHWNALFCKKK